jgi:hypothetical protein
MITTISCPLACAALFASVAVATAGIRPAYSDRLLSEPTNAAAIRARV